MGSPRFWTERERWVPLQHVPRIGDPAVHGAGRRGEWPRQQGSRAYALAAFEIAIAGADGILPGRDGIAVHPQTHRAAGLTPIRARGLEYVGVSGGLGVALDLLRARYDEQSHTGRDLAALED